MLLLPTSLQWWNLPLHCFSWVLYSLLYPPLQSSTQPPWGPPCPVAIMSPLYLLSSRLVNPASNSLSSYCLPLRFDTIRRALLCTPLQHLLVPHRTLWPACHSNTLGGAEHKNFRACPCSQLPWRAGPGWRWPFQLRCRLGSCHRGQCCPRNLALWRRGSHKKRALYFLFWGLRAKVTWANSEAETAYPSGLNLTSSFSTSSSPTGMGAKDTALDVTIINPLQTATIPGQAQWAGVIR